MQMQMQKQKQMQMQKQMQKRMEKQILEVAHLTHTCVCMPAETRNNKYKDVWRHCIASHHLLHEHLQNFGSENS